MEETALWRKRLRRILGCFQPEYICALCWGSADTLLCAGCQNDLPLNTGPKLCTVCDITLQSGDSICGSCLKTPPRYDRIVAGMHYVRPVDTLLHALKNPSGLIWLETLCAPLLDRLPQGTLEIDAVTSIPMRPWRQWRRGYNQSAILAQYIATRLSLPYQPLMKKTRNTAGQHALKKAERLHNLRGSFSLTEKVEGMRLAVVDDVVTTGATAAYAAECLKKAGAQYVAIWSVARTPLDYSLGRP